MKLVFSDYHGTWDSHPEIRGDVDAIVTGETWEEWEDVMDTYEGKKVPIFFNPTPDGKLDLLSVCNHKAHVINTAGATKFYENKQDQADMLKILCPKCTIVLVKDEENAI